MTDILPVHCRRLTIAFHGYLIRPDMNNGKTHSMPIEDGWLRHWLVLGPCQALVTDRPALITAEKMPGLLLWGGEQNPDGWPEPGRAVPPRHNEWRLLESTGPTCSLGKPGEGTWPRWFYAATYLRVYEQVQVNLEISCNGCFMLRADGKPVSWHQGWPQSIDMPPNTAQLRLTEGCHLLLLKLTTYGSRPAFAMRLKDEQGNPLAGTEPVAVRTAPLQSMRLDLPSRGKRLSAPADMPSLCQAAKWDEEALPFSRSQKPWSESIPACRFRTLDGYRARWQTSVSSCYTQQELRLLCECENHRPSPIREPFPWLSDHVLILLDPEHSHSASRAVLLNLHGETWTRGVEEDAIAVETEAREHGWAGALRIPFHAVGKSSAPDRGERWGFNVVRVCPDASDGLTYWFAGDPHTGGLPETSDAPQADASAPWWPDRPALLGHLEFGNNDLKVETLELEKGEPGRHRLRITIDNHGGKARAFLHYCVTGTADTWPEPVLSESELEVGEKDWLLPASSHSGTTVTLGPLPPGRYNLLVEIEVPGRDFGQMATIPFRCPRELRDSSSGTVRSRPGGTSANAGSKQAKSWMFHLAEEPPHELLLTASGAWPDAGLMMHWNGQRLEPAYIDRTGSATHLLRAAVPASVVREGENELVVKSATETAAELPEIDDIRLRLCEDRQWNETEGKGLYRLRPADQFHLKGIPKLLSTSARGIPHEACAFVKVEEGQTISFPVLLDRPGGTLDITHADFSLEASFVVPHETESPPRCTVFVNGKEVDSAFSEKQCCFLDREPAGLWKARGDVSEDALRNGINKLKIEFVSIGAAWAFLYEVRLHEDRWDDPEVVDVPGAVSVREGWEIELRTDRPHTLQCTELPSHVETRFECPLEIRAGTAKLVFEALSPSAPAEAELEFEDVTTCFTTPAVQPRPPLLPRQRRSQVQTFTLKDGPLEVQLAAMRGRARLDGYPTFRVETSHVTLPHAPDNRAGSFEWLMDASLFLAGAECPDRAPQGFPAVTRRDGLPAADVALIDTTEGSGSLWTDGRPEPKLATVAAGLLTGAHFPGPAGPLFPEGPTGHFSGTPRDKYDIVAGSDIISGMNYYRLLVPAQTAIPPTLLDKLLTLVEEDGCSLVLNPTHAESLKSLDIKLAAPEKTRRACLHSTKGLAEETIVAQSARYSVLETAPEEVLATCEPDGQVMMGRWGRGKGNVYVIATDIARGKAEQGLFGQCMNRIVRLHGHSVCCNDELIKLSPFPEAPEFRPQDSFASEESDLPPQRIYAAHCGWWKRPRESVECSFTIRDRQLPLVWAQDNLQAVYITGQIAVAPEDSGCYIEGASQREAGYEIQVRGNGSHGIIVLPLIGRVEALSCRGEYLEFDPVRSGTHAVRVTLDVYGLARFQVTIE